MQAKVLPAQVKEMSDDEALWALGLENRQDKMSPLEVGMHANLVVEKGRPGRGQTGGISEYARLMGVSEAPVRKAMRAADVFNKIRPRGRDFNFVPEDGFVADEFSAKTKHLYEISHAPQYAWPDLASLLSDESYTVQKIAATTKRVIELTSAVEYCWTIYIRPSEFLKNIG